jgi:MraZ protein
MYFGPHYLVMDETGRINTPRKLREIMNVRHEDVWYVTRGYRGSLYLYNLKQWRSVVKRAERSLDDWDPEAHDFLRLVYGCAIEISVDKQGRMPIPSALWGFANLRRDVVLVGMKNHLELWDKEAWEAFQEKYGPSMEAMAADLIVKNRTAIVPAERGAHHDQHTSNGSGPGNAPAA